MPCALPESPSPTPGSREGLPQRPPPYGLQSPGWDSVGDRVGRTTQTESGNKIKGLLYPGGDKETGHPRIGLIPPGLHHFLLLHAPDLTPRGPSPSTLGLSPRRVLNKLNFSVPEDVMRKIAQCAPGVVELVLLPLRQRLEERQRLRKQRSSSLQVPPHSSFLPPLFGSLPGSRKSRLADRCGRGCLAKGAWPWGTRRRQGAPWAGASPISR